MEISNTSGAEGAESEDEGEDAGLSQQSAESLDPFDLLINQELPDPTLKTLDADTDTDSDPDPDELSSVDGETSEDDLASDDKAMQAGTRQKRREVVRSMRQKLDGMLYYFFEHLEECMGGKAADFPAAEMAAQSLASSSKSTSPEALTPMLPSLRPRRTPPTPVQSISHFQTLLNLFSLQILPTLATQHIPFLLFLCSSVSAAHTDLYLGLLVSQALYGTASTSENAITHRISLNQRIAATVYIGSIVCRARFVTDEQARQVITYLLAYIDGKLRQVMSRCADELPLFYAVCQAVMLIFCFRWRGFTCEKEGDSVVDDMEMDEESVEEPSESKWMQDLEILQRALTSELNPLLVSEPD